MKILLFLIFLINFAFGIEQIFYKTLSFSVITLLLLGICIFVMYKKLNKQIKAQMFKKKDPTDQKELSKEKPFEKDKEISKIDILYRLKFLAETMFEECCKNDNVINIIYDRSNPRIFHYTVLQILDIINNLSKFCISEFTRATITIKFDTLKTDKDEIYFNISIISNKIFEENSKNIRIKQLLQTNAELENNYISKAKNIADNMRITLNFKYEDRNTIFSFKTALKFFDHMDSFQKNKKYRMNILIAENNKEIFTNISKDAMSLGASVKPCSDWNSIKRHLDDFIYIADVVFIQANILRNIKDEINYLTDIKKKKNIEFVIIANNKNALDIMEKININVFYLKMPYVYEDLYAIFDIILKIKQDREENKSELA